MRETVLPLKQFNIASVKDSIFTAANAVIENNTVLVWNDAVNDPSEVRYSWQNLPVAELYNNAALPASPFRTDKRIVNTQGKE